MSQISLDELRELDDSIDSVSAVQSGSWSVAANITNASIAVTQSGAWTVAVDGISAGGNDLVINADGSLNVQGEVEIDDVSDSILITKKSVTDTSALLLTSELTNRRKITIQNLGSQDIFINDTTATVDDIKVPRKSSASFFFSSAVTLAAITASGTADVRILEEAQA